MAKLRFILAMAAGVLGLTHCIFGVIVFGGYTLELVWFLGAGIAMMIAALSNLVSRPSRMINALIVIYIALILGVAPQPQVWLGLFLFGSLAVLSSRQIE